MIFDLPLSKRILVYGQLPPPYHGSNIMTGIFLKALRGNGFNVELSNKDLSKNIAEVNKITPVKFIRIFPILWRFFNNLIHYKPNTVVFFISSTRMGLIVEEIVVTLTRVFKIPYVLYLHTSGYKALYSNGIFNRKLIKKIFSQASACLILGKTFLEEIRPFYKGKIYVLPNCLEEDFPIKEKTESHFTRILFLSNLCEGKGLLTLIKAVPYVIAESKDIKFLVAGPWQEMQYRSEILDFVKQKNLETYIQFLGPVYGKKKQELFSQCDIFVFPSNYDSFALVSLEAMRAGLPVISTNIGALPEVIIDGKTGFVIPLKNPKVLAGKIKILLENPNLRKEMGQEGRKRFAEYYSFETYATNLNRIMNELFSN